MDLQGFGTIYQLKLEKAGFQEKKAIKIAKKENQLPLKQIKLFCKYIDISLSDFFKITEKFRNKKIWKLDNKKKWYIRNFFD